MNVIETNRLTKFYGRARGVINLDLSVNEGDIFGFIGPNGAGKSTTIRTLLGLISPSSGSASVFGKPCKPGNTEILRDVGYMPSEAMFYPRLRVRETIALSARLRGLDCTARAKDLCDRFAVDMDKRIDELSLGNRRKVSIVCALQHSPKLLILDEPTSGLDPLMQKEFFNTIRECSEQGSTVFLSSHVLSEVARYCKHAGVVRDGEMIACGTVEELTSSTARRVSVHGAGDFAVPDGALDVRRDNGHVSFLYRGEMAALVNSLQGYPITDLTVTEPDLEEIFLHFYGEERENDLQA